DAPHGPIVHPFPTRRSSDLTAGTLMEVQMMRRKREMGIMGGMRRMGLLYPARPIIPILFIITILSIAAPLSPQHGCNYPARRRLDRKSTRLNSSHEWISYAV